MCNLMQGMIRDFSISSMKNIPQNKTNIAVCCKKTRKTKDTQLTGSEMQWGNINVHKCIGFSYFWHTQE